MTLLDLLIQDGHTMKWKAATSGGEYAGPSPWCGGNDRFCVWPQKKGAGKYWCRQCRRSGDAIQYLIDYRNMTFPEAYGFLGISINHTRACRRKQTEAPKEQIKECPAHTPEWQQNASLLVRKGILICSEGCTDLTGS